MRAPRSASGAELDGRRSPSGAELDGRALTLSQAPRSLRLSRSLPRHALTLSSLASGPTLVMSQFKFSEKSSRRSTQPSMLSQCGCAAQDDARGHQGVLGEDPARQALRGLCLLPRVVENLSAGLVKSHTVEVYVYEQLVGDKEAALYFKRMPAFGLYTVFWQPPTPSRDADKDGLNIRIKNRNLLSSILKVLSRKVSFSRSPGLVVGGSNSSQTTVRNHSVINIIPVRPVSIDE